MKQREKKVAKKKKPHDVVFWYFSTDAFDHPGLVSVQANAT